MRGALQRRSQLVDGWFIAVREGGIEAAQHTVKNEREEMMTDKATVLFIYQTAEIDNTTTQNQRKKDTSLTKMIRECHEH